MKIVSYEEFDRCVSSTHPIILLVSDHNCGPCKQVERILDKLEDMYDGKLHIYKMYANNNLCMVKKYNIGSVPTVLCIRGGMVVEQVVGNIGILGFDNLAKKFLNAQ